MNVHSLRCFVGAEIGCASAGCDLRDLRLVDCLRILTFTHSVIQIAIFGYIVHSWCKVAHSLLSTEIVYHYNCIACKMK